jgi:hypothetical protein
VGGAIDGELEGLEGVGSTDFGAFEGFGVGTLGVGMIVDGLEEGIREVGRGVGGFFVGLTDLKRVGGAVGSFEGFFEGELDFGFNDGGLVG